MTPIKEQPGRPRRFRSPSFEGFRAASEASSRAMRGNKARDTQPELLLRRALRVHSLEYHTHEGSLPGRPDLVFPAARLAVFCDGDFWHGRYWSRLKKELAGRANAEYWIAKIAANRARDGRLRRELRKAGWTVLRVWETDIRRNPDAVAREIAMAARLLRGATATEHQRSTARQRVPLSDGPPSSRGQERG